MIDEAPERMLGGELRIDALNNVLLLDAKAHKLWDSYEIGVNPDVSAGKVCLTDCWRHS